LTRAEGTPSHADPFDDEEKTMRARHHLSPLTLVFLSAALSATFPGAPARAQRPAEPPPLDAGLKSTIVERVSGALLDVYVFPDVAQQMVDLLRQNLGSGDYDQLRTLPAFTARLTRDLRSISHDLHLGVAPYTPAAEESDRQTPEQQRRVREAQRRRNYAFPKLEILEGNVGYLEMTNFLDAEQAGATAVAALNFLANVDALIIDLRNNGGGSPSMIQLIFSYLLDEPTHLNSFYIRESDRYDQFWTQAHVAGPRLTDVPVFVLVSRRTFSAAEEFSYDMQALERGTIVGDTTRGGAHPVRAVTFPEAHVSVRVPFGRAVNPVTGTNWEGIGIAPDIVVPADEALAVAHAEALRALRERETDEAWRAMLGFTQRRLEADRHPVVLDPSQLTELAGEYQGEAPVTVAVEGSDLYLVVGENQRFRIRPLGEDYFEVEGRPEPARVVRDASGAVVAIEVLTSAGQGVRFTRVGP